MSATSMIEAYVSATPDRSFVRVRDLVEATELAAAHNALSRHAGEWRLVRVHDGVYWKSPASRYGLGAPSPLDVALEVAGKGAGPSGWSASHVLGLSTQLPARTTVAVIGRTPTVGDTKFIKRNNLERFRLNPTEIALVEILVDNLAFVEASVAEVTATVRRLHRKKAIDVGLIRDVARTESSLRAHPDRLAPLGDLAA